jgi:thiamine biosynthesis lipoprotein
MRTLCFLLLLFLASCRSEPSNRYEVTQSDALTAAFDGHAMTIPYHIVIGRRLSDNEKSTLKLILQAVFNDVDSTFNRWNPRSELSQLNLLEAGQPMTLSPILSQFLNRTSQIVQATDGLFDPSVYPMQQLWEKNLLQGSIPSQIEIDALSPAIGWDKIHINDNCFFKDHKLTALDLGGIVKGYCVDLIVDKLMACGYNDLLVEWGGEIRAVGLNPEGRPWRVYIRGLNSSFIDNKIAETDLVNMAIATSGDYLQNWSLIVDDQRISYTHIIDPRTMSAKKVTRSSIASCSIMAQDCMLADALATAAMLLEDVKTGKEWLQVRQVMLGVEDFWLVSRQKNEIYEEFENEKS